MKNVMRIVGTTLEIVVAIWELTIELATPIFVMAYMLLLALGGYYLIVRPIMRLLTVMYG